MGFNTPDINADERRALHETWILSKAFQDLMRGVRASLEEAYFATELLAAGQITTATSTTLEDLLRPYRDKAAGMKFPPLLSAVNARLEKPLEFSEAYRSMQAAKISLGRWSAGDLSAGSAARPARSISRRTGMIQRRKAFHFSEAGRRQAN
jgi:hypothetical protein